MIMPATTLQASAQNATATASIHSQWINKGRSKHSTIKLFRSSAAFPADPLQIHPHFNAEVAQHPLPADGLAPSPAEAVSRYQHKLSVACRLIGLDLDHQPLLRIHQPAFTTRLLLELGEIGLAFPHAVILARMQVQRGESVVSSTAHLGISSPCAGRRAVYRLSVV